jgi:hypothetical protein
MHISVGASELETENHILNVKVNCKEGNVTCNDVIFILKNKSTGSVKKYKGNTWHNWHNQNPTRFLGYEFKSGDISYTASEVGIFTKIRGTSEVIFEEKGVWKF